MIISRTPFRISFFGGGTDYPVWYREHGGAVLGTTIDKYCYLTLRDLPPFFPHRTRLVYSVIETVDDNRQIGHPSVRECLRYVGIDRGLEIHHDGDLPSRTGLGSSSSFTVGMLNALYSMCGIHRSKMQLALEAIHVEQELIGESVGSQDQTLAALGGFQRVEFHRDGSIEALPIVLSADRRREFESHLLLVFTGFVRNASDIAQEQIKETPNRTRELEAMRQLVDEATDVITGHSDITEFGRLLHESWMLKRSLTDLISSKSFDELYDGAMRAGAVGGKMLGAGGGGFALFFVPPEARAKVIESLGGLMHVPVRLEHSGAQIVFYEPGDSAEDGEVRERLLARTNGARGSHGAHSLGAVAAGD